MYGVVNEGGTGGRARLPNIEVCGKTGTAQLASEDYAKSKGKKDQRRQRMVRGFAPCYAPEIVVVALFEQFPGHGQYAAPHRAGRHESLLRQEGPACPCCSSRRQRADRRAGADPDSAARQRRSRFGQQALSGERAVKHGADIFRSAISIGPLLVIVLLICARGSAADLQRHHGHRIPQRLVEADLLRLRRTAADVADRWSIDYHSLLHYVPAMYVSSIVACCW